MKSKLSLLAIGILFLLIFPIKTFSNSILETYSLDKSTIANSINLTIDLAIADFDGDGIQDGTEMEYTMEHQWNTQWNRHTTMSIN